MDKRVDERAVPMKGQPASMDDVRTVVYPAPVMIARVQFAEPPQEAPPELAPFLTPVLVDGRVADWLLTSDTVAFGEPYVAGVFKDWRGRWLRQWELEPVDSLQRLFRLVVEDAAMDERSQRLAEKLVLTPFEYEDLVIQPSRAVLLPELIERARVLAAEVEILSSALVDTTEGSSGAGLLIGWPPSSKERLLARDDRSCVALHPTRRLCLEVYDGSSMIEQLTDLTEVVFHGTSAIVRTAERSVEFDADQVRPLAWIALGARSYRVRRVPTVLVVANTIARLPDAARVSIEYGEELVLTGVAPVVTGP
jgi:hypothetical protein